MRIQQFSIADFSELKESWQSLLKESNANTLFLSWDWMYNWWQVYAEGTYELLLLGLYEGQKLICLAPLFKQRAKGKFGLPIMRVEMIGISSTSGAGLFSEYLQFISHRDHAEVAIKKILDWVHHNISFDELLFIGIVCDSPTHNCLNQFCLEHKYYKRPHLVSPTYGIETENSFEDYIKKLGKNSRLQLYNRRKVLESMGEVILLQVNNDNFSYVLDQLNTFHLTRWEKEFPCEQHKNFISRLIQDSDKNVSGVMVTLADILIGCTLNIECEQDCYNFQLGFENNVDKKISMGTITLGYDIEQCFNKPGLKYYDMMVGEGKNSNYKTRFAKEGDFFERFQLIRNPIFKILYRTQDLMNRLSTRLN